MSFTIAITVAALVFFAGWDLLGAQGLKSEPRLASSTLFDLVKLSFGVVAGAGALVALVVAYRRQRVDEDAALRDATRLHTERFTSAVSQLGAESAAVRLGGVYALAGLADDAPTRDLRQTCIDVLCAYLRLPYTAEPDLPSGDADARHLYLSLREVRHTVYASSATTFDCHPNTRAPGRAMTWTSRASSSTGGASAARCSPAARCTSTTRSSPAARRNSTARCSLEAR
ncbi:hypothetical protein [Streptomyces virginiae]|uniref:hypothetical protein n=1 Tax=Streptomyces virginiae TaxID=1961 RepID=UPI0034246F8A